MQGECRYGPPQICDGPIGPSLPDSRFAFRWLLRLGVLEGDDLLLELVTVTLQYLLLAVRSGLLLLYLLLHVVKHLKNLAFVQLCWLDAGGCPLAMRSLYLRRCAVVWQQVE